MKLLDMTLQEVLEYCSKQDCSSCVLNLDRPYWGNYNGELAGACAIREPKRWTVSYLDYEV